MMIQPTDIQLLEMRAQGALDEDETCYLQHDRGWQWTTEDRQWRASDAQVADALLVRLVDLEEECSQLRAKARLGDALEQALQAQHVVDSLDSATGFTVETQEL